MNNTIRKKRKQSFRQRQKAREQQQSFMLRLLMCLVHDAGGELTIPDIDSYNQHLAGKGMYLYPDEGNNAVTIKIRGAQ